MQHKVLTMFSLLLGVSLIINKITRVDCDKCLAVNKICRHSGKVHCCALSGHTRNWLCPIAFDDRSKSDQWSGVLRSVSTLHRSRHSLTLLAFSKDTSLPWEHRLLASVSGAVDVHVQARWCACPQP